jgi:hypothetical protein
MLLRCDSLLIVPVQSISIFLAWACYRKQGAGINSKINIDIASQYSLFILELRKSRTKKGRGEINTDRR